MECPYCKNEMEKGVMRSPQEIAWLPKKPKFFGAAAFHEGSFVLSAHNYWKGSHVIAHLCRKCKKVIIDYQEG